MEVNDYVRTETGKIGKIILFKGDMARVDCDKFITYKSNHNEIVKSSPQIIDLIEVGDYVNGHKVFDDMRVDTDDYGNDFIEIGIEIDNMLNHYIREEEIKSIVTKESFRSVEYEVGE